MSTTCKPREWYVGKLYGSSQCMDMPFGSEQSLFHSNYLGVCDRRPCAAFKLYLSLVTLRWRRPPPASIYLCRQALPPKQVYRLFQLPDLTSTIASYSTFPTFTSSRFPDYPALDLLLGQTKSVRHCAHSWAYIHPLDTRQTES